MNRVRRARRERYKTDTSEVEFLFMYVGKKRIAQKVTSLAARFRVGHY